MARKANLRAVGPADAPEPEPKRYTVTEAAESGTIRDQLVALRDRVAKTVQDPTCPPRDLASLSRRLMEITKEIEAIDARKAQDDGDAATPDDDWEAV